MRTVRQQLAVRTFLLTGLAVAVMACGTTNERLSDLEAENEALREELEAIRDPSTGTSIAASSSTTSPPTPASTTTSSLPSTTQGATPDVSAGGDEGTSVLSVTDGDTMRVLVDGENEPLRLIGINAPESGECLAAEATSRLADLVGEGPVRLESDVSDRDDFGRLLRYVHAGDVFVNEVLVREGLALARRYEPDTARSGDLEAAQSAAEADQVGMWNPEACGSAGGASLEIGHIRYDADGDDNHNLNDEWVEITNPGETSADLSGWSLKDESASHRYGFPAGFHLDGEATVRIHTGCGEDTSTALYWCNQDSAVWNNSGDTVFVLDPNGNVVVSESYSP